MVRIGALQRTKKPSPAEDPFVEPRRRGPLALPRRHMDRISPHPFGSDPPPSRTSVVSLSILVGTGLVPVDGMRGSIVVSCRSSSQMAHRTTKRRNSTSHLEAKGSREGEKMWPGSQETSSSTGSLPRRHTVDGSEGQGGSQGSGNNLYKTELCRSFEETGSCRYGNKCQFAHGKEELRPVARHPKYKTEVCRTFTTHGTCPYGTRCRFIHYYSPKHEKDGNVSPPITPTQKTPNLPFTGLLSRTSSAHAPVERTPSTRRLPIFEQLVAQDYAENNASNSYEFLQYVEDMQI